MLDKDREHNGNPQYYMKPYEPREHSLSTHTVQLEEEHMSEDEAHLGDYLNVLIRRKWVVLVFFLVVVVTVTLSTFMVNPLYKSSVTIKIDKANPNVLTFKDVYQIERPDGDYYQTQYKILRSRSIAKRVIKKLNLAEHSEFAEEKGQGAIRSAIFNLFSARDKVAAQAMEDGLSIGLVDAFTERLEVTPDRNSQLVTVSFVAYSPELARDVANAVAETYIDFNIESKFDATQQARKWLGNQIEVMKAKVELSEEALNEYSAGNEMIFLTETKDKQSLLTQRLSELSTALNEATADRIRKEAIYREVVESGAENPIISNNQLLLDLKKQYASKEAEYYNLRKTYRPEYPRMKRLKAQMEAIKMSIEQETNNIIKSIESDYHAALKREKYLSDTFITQKNEALDFQRRTVQYQILKREVDTNNELYNNLLQRMKEVGVSATMTATNIQILDRAEFPRGPYKPKKAMNILLSIIIGLMGGVGAAFFAEYFDRTVKDTQEIERGVRLPALGIVPFHKELDTPSLQMIANNNGHIAEAFRSIGTFVQLSSAYQPPKSILVTSPGEGEGKSTFSINTAIALTESLGRGLLIDADLRRPMLHKAFDMDNTDGLSTYLSGNTGSDSELARPTPVQGLDVILSGPVPPNPSALLGSGKMGNLLRDMYERYEFVVIDSPPVLGLADSKHLSRFVDGVVIVAMAGQTHKNNVIEAKKVLVQINANILGVALNGIKENNLKYGYYSYYYSSYHKER